MVALPYPVRSNPSAYSVFGEPRLINAYAEVTGDDSKAPYALLPCAGLVPWGADATGACRGMIWLEDDQKLYAVFGYYLYDIASDGTKTSEGLVSGTSPVYMARNDAATTQVMIVSDGKAFSLVDGTLTLQDNLDDDGNSIFTDSAGTAQNPAGVTQAGGYFIIWLDGGRFYVSELASTTFTALRFATAESDPDGLTKAHGKSNTLYLIGTQTIEVWAVNGGADFPFSRIQGAHLNFGSRSPHTIVDVDQSVVMVASDNTVRAVQGYSNQVISSKEVARLIEAETDKSALYAFTYSRGENKFYCLQGSGWTREYNFATGFWHHRYTGADQQWQAAYYARAFDKDIFGSRVEGATFEGSYTTLTEDGNPLIWGFDTQIFHAYPNGLSFSRIDIDMEVGGGPTHSTEGDLMLSWSDDNLHSWKGERQLGLGYLGDFKKTVSAVRLGSCGRSGRAFRFRISDPVVRSVALIDVDAHQVPAR